MPPELLAHRYELSDTRSNQLALTSVIRDPHCCEVTLFASPTLLDAHVVPRDGFETNFPLVSAIAKYQIADIATLYVLFDGCFLTAQRSPRDSEVRGLLDVAQSSGKVTFSRTRAPFTSRLQPKEAVAVLLAVGNTSPLDEVSRTTYFSMLSNVSEREIDAMNARL